MSNKAGDVERVTEPTTYHHQKALAPPASRLPPSSSTTSSSSSSSGRVVATTSAMKVRDDPEGHLIYSRGDRLDTRCKLKVQ